MKLALLAAAFAATGAKELTEDNFQKETKGKKVFIKFQAPWWGHCKSMKPAWDQLAEEYESSTTSGVYDVDCTADGKSLCEANEVSGYPTIKYGEPGDLVDYTGGRSFEELKKFAEESLGPKCGPDNLDLCSEKDKALIEGFLKMPKDELEAMEKETGTKLTKKLKAHEKKASKWKSKKKEFDDEKAEEMDEIEASKAEHAKFEKNRDKASKTDIAKFEKRAKLMKDRSAKFEKRKKALEDEKAELDKEKDAVTEEFSASGLKLMRLAMVHKAKEEL